MSQQTWRRNGGCRILGDSKWRTLNRPISENNRTIHGGITHKTQRCDCEEAVDTLRRSLRLKYSAKF